jgi:hypothetical protein
MRIIKALPAVIVSAIVVLTTVACGKKKSGSQPASPSSGDSANGSLRPYVEPGSFDIIALPNPDEAHAIHLLQLFAEEGAEIYYSPAPFDRADEAVKYELAHQILAPLEIWVRSKVGAQLGPLRHFHYRAPELHDFREGTLGRLSTPHQDWRHTLKTASAPILQRPESRSAVWLTVHDPEGDAGSGVSSIDILRLQGAIDDDFLRAEVTFAGQTIQSEEDEYILEIGDPRIGVADFGPGANFGFRVVCRSSQCIFEDPAQSTSKEPTAGSFETRFEGARWYLAVARSWINTIINDSGMIIRVTASRKKAAGLAWDRTLPLYLHLNVRSTTSSFTWSSGKDVDLTLFDIAETPNSRLEFLYHSLSSQLLPRLFESQQIPFATVGSIPLITVEASSSKLTGLNSTDRGVLSALRSNASILSAAQLLAHEYAHFQNAMFPLATERWIQEGMSEWAAERALYQLFPKAEVYEYLSQLRIKPWLARLSGQWPDLPLSDWKKFEDESNYEKAFAFFQVLESVIGSDALLKVFRIAVSMPMNTDQFVRVVQNVSGQPIDALLSYWLMDGPPHADFDPRTLYSDQDQDGIYLLDEQLRETHANSPWSNTGGLSDAEQLIIESFPDQETSKEMMLQLRQPQPLARAAEPISGWSAVTGASLRDYERPVLLRPPYRFMGYHGQSTQPVVDRLQPAFRRQGNRFAEVSSQPAGPLDGMLPYPLRADFELRSVASQLYEETFFGADIKDMAHDIPMPYGAFDITGLRASLLKEGALRIAVKTLEPVEFASVKGRFNVSFETYGWSSSALPVLRHREDWRVADGRVSLNGSSQVSSAPFHQHLLHPLSDSLVIDFPDFQKRVNSLAANESVRVCISSSYEVDPKHRINDEIGCLPIAQGSGLKTLFVTAMARSGETHHVYVTSPKSLSNDAMTLYSQVIMTSVLKMGELFDRALLDRQVWPMYLAWSEDNSTRTEANAQLGVYFASRAPDSSFTETAYMYLVVEQLARLMTLDINRRVSSRAPLWLRELWAQWTTLSVMEQIAPREQLSAYLEDYRLGHIRCFYILSCSNRFLVRSYYPTENRQSLASWQMIYDGTLRRHWMLMFARELNAALGTSDLAEFFSSWFNGIPEQMDWNAALGKEDPTRQQWIHERLGFWVEGHLESGQIRFDDAFAEWQPGPHRGSYQFEVNYLQQFTALSAEEIEGVFVTAD